MIDLAIYSWVIAALAGYDPLWRYWRFVAIIFPVGAIAALLYDYSSFFAIEPIFALLFLLTALISNIFNFNRRSSISTSLGYIACGSGLYLLYGNLLTGFFMLELIGLANLLLIWRGGKKVKIYGLRYIIVHVGSGMLFLAGIMQLEAANYLTLSALLINIGYLPLSGWLKDAYQHAPPTAIISLFSYATKANMYILVTLFSGMDTLPILGVATIIYGAIYALFSRSSREILCYNLIQHLGVVTVLIGFANNQDWQVFIATNLLTSVVYLATLLILTIRHEEKPYQLSIWHYIAMFIAFSSAIAAPYSPTWLSENAMLLHNNIPALYLNIIHFSNYISILYFTKLMMQLIKAPAALPSKVIEQLQLKTAQNHFYNNICLVILTTALLTIAATMLITIDNFSLWPSAAMLNIALTDSLYLIAALIIYYLSRGFINKLPLLKYDIGNLYLMILPLLETIIIKMDSYLQKFAELINYIKGKFITVICNYLWDFSHIENSNFANILLSQPENAVMSHKTNIKILLPMTVLFIVGTFL